MRTIKKSTAPFKLLCTGMVWYPKGNREKDHWETYAVERDVPFAFIKREDIRCHSDVQDTTSNISRFAETKDLDIRFMSVSSPLCMNASSRALMLSIQLKSESPSAKRIPGCGGHLQEAHSNLDQYDGKGNILIQRRK